MLKKLGFEVELATDGLDALEKLAAHIGDYRFIMMDLTMPQVSGDEAFRFMNAQYPQLPIIIMTGYSDESAKKLFAEYSPAAFMQKPFVTEDVIKVIKSILKI